LRGVVRNEGEFLQINVHFPFCWFVGISERNIAATLAKSSLAALKVLREASTGEASNRKQEIDRQYHTIPTPKSQRPKAMHSWKNPKV